MSDYKVEDLKQDIEYIKRNIKSHDVILHGTKETSKPDGLIYHVSENTRHREFAARLHWALLTMVIGLVVHQLLELFKILAQ